MTKQRIVKVFNNQRVHAIVDGKDCHFRSKFEYNWAMYLQFLKEQGQIDNWEYEPDRFLFPAEVRGAKEYTPEAFEVIKENKNV